MTTRPGLPATVQGALWMLFSACCYVLSATLMRTLGNAYPPFQMTLIRAVVGVLLLTPFYLRAGRTALRPGRLGLMTLASGLTYLAILCWFLGAANVPVANFFALQFTTPLFTILMATLILRERNDPGAWIATAAGFGGVLMILRPGIIEVSVGALATLASCFGYASVNTTFRSLSRNISATGIAFWANLLIVPMSLPLAIATWRTPIPGDWPLILAISAMTTIALISVTRAISLADARIVQPVNFMRMPIGAAVGWIVFSEFPDVWTWSGAVVIFIASSYAVGRGTRRA